MSDFPEILNRFITEKNIHVYSMVKYCDIDRSTMYKIIKGTRRPPSEEIHDKIAAFMRLSPAETQQFEHAWQISVTGKVNYYRRKNAESFLLNFPAFSDMPGEFPGSARKPFSSKKECISFSDQNEFSAFFKYIIEQEKISGDGRIGLRSLCHPLFQVPDQNSICRIRSSSSPAFSGWSFKENGVHCYCSKNTVKKYISDLRLHASDNNLLNFSAQHFHFLKSPLAEASESIQIYAEDKNMFLHFKNTSGGSVYLDLQEPRLASALLDYIKNIEKDFLYTEEENIRYVKEINQKI